MHSSLPAPTKAQVERFEIIQEIGCIACILKTQVFHTPAEIHHLVDCGRRRGHDATVALCAFHHRSVIENNFSERFTRRVKGPSLAKEPAAFVKEFGTDAELLEAQEIILKNYLDLVA